MKPRNPFLTSVLILLFLIIPTYTSHAENINCNNIVQALRPCVVFFRGRSGVIGIPPSACCAGVSILSQIANNTANSVAVCRCVQSAIKNLKISDATAKALPHKCGIALPFTFSPYVKCPEVAICECVKSGLKDPHVNAKAAESLTSGCQMLLGYPTTPNVNCFGITAPNTKLH